jgi:ferritin-like metal-binding protein YciE
MESQVRELLVEELKDAYSAEKQALRCMQKVLRMASAPALREGIELHIEQTQTQIERVEQAMEKLQTHTGSGHRRRHAEDRALRDRCLRD